MQHAPDLPIETDTETAPTEAADDESTAELDGFGRDFDSVDAALEALDNDDLDGAEAQVAKLTGHQSDG